MREREGVGEGDRPYAPPVANSWLCHCAAAMQKWTFS